MNEKLQYAEMLEIPVNTCNITYKPPKKRKGRAKNVDADKVKAELVDKINMELDRADTGVNQYAFELMDTSVARDHIYEAQRLLSELEELIK